MPDYGTVSEVILYVEDMDRMASFYGETLGLEVAGGDPDHGFVKYDTGTCNLCLHAGRDGALGEFAPTFVFAVEDLEAARSHLAAAGVEVGEVREPAPETRVFDARDPEGNRFSVETSTGGG